jgi:phosphoribosyl 1,2-cyclic phosphate phosphodiesterase
MKFKYLGTAAAEGIPALFCTCDCCRKSREIGGRALRTRSQAIIDDRLLIDFPADTYSHILANKIDLSVVENCLITHKHGDHLYPNDIRMLEPSYSHMQEGYKLTFHGSEKVGVEVLAKISPKMEKSKICEFHEVKPFETFEIAVGGDDAKKYRVTALPAIHDPNSGPLFYIINDGEKTVLYAHDTNYFSDEIWAYFAEAKPHFDMVSLDCTEACKPALTYIGHMNFFDNIKVRNRMLDEGYADEGTIFVSNHFSHNGINAVYDDFVPIAAKEGFKVSYDGMTLHI